MVGMLFPQPKKAWITAGETAFKSFLSETVEKNDVVLCFLEHGLDSLLASLQIILMVAGRSSDS